MCVADVAVPVQKRLRLLVFEVGNVRVEAGCPERPLFPVQKLVHVCEVYGRVLRDLLQFHERELSDLAVPVFRTEHFLIFPLRPLPRVLRFGDLFQHLPHSGRGRHQPEHQCRACFLGERVGRLATLEEADVAVRLPDHVVLGVGRIPAHLRHHVQQNLARAHPQMRVAAVRRHSPAHDLQLQNALLEALHPPGRRLPDDQKLGLQPRLEEVRALHALVGRLLGHDEQEPDALPVKSRLLSQGVHRQKHRCDQRLRVAGAPPGQADLPIDRPQLALEPGRHHVDVRVEDQRERSRVGNFPRVCQHVKPVLPVSLPRLRFHRLELHGVVSLRKPQL
mmetsp:Transcript_27156/g.68500  ORF Transcript_27156/g.68500 Transcript_27156/m.68500 type:complete len:335 (+) Transcript_27156:437-1441(+)